MESRIPGPSPALDPRLARNTALNLVGNGAPMLVALVAIPVLLRGIGTERFGILTLAWMLVGYFSLFDLGIARAMTKSVSEHLARGELRELPSLVWTSLYLMLGFGALGGVVAAGVTPLLVDRVLNIPPELVEESTSSFHLLALCVPVVLVTAGLRGVLEAQQRFGLINAIKIPANAANFLAPLAALPFTRSLAPVVGLLVAGRVLVFLVHLGYSLNSLPGLLRPVRPNTERAKELLGFGAWLTVSNVVYPLMSYLDRFFIGAVLTMREVAYYVTPYELVTKLVLISFSLQATIFPAFTALAATRREDLCALHDRAVVHMLMVYTPIAAAVIVLADPFLSVWLGGEFPSRSAAVMRLLSVGVLLNAVGGVPYNAIQAMGRADLTAKFHLAELPVYVAMLVVFTKAMGIGGAALAWTLRLALDTTIWLWLAKSIIRTGPAGMRLIGHFGAAGGVLVAAAALARLPDLPWKVGLLLILVAFTATVSWRQGLSDTEKASIRETARQWSGRRKIEARGARRVEP
ncbi:MAG: flippase [Deltaproteobacteria bacterium]|nr:flippase [Deltaproteobacteria bacterium]